MPFKKVLIANRGEIARRVIRTCKRLGIATVAVHSDADAGLAFVEEADQAVRLGGNAVRESYLSLDKLRAAIVSSGADAVHPGYGMLSEDPSLARLVRESGAVFVGPSPEALASLGDKVRARELARAAGLEPPPGSDGPVDAERARAVAARIGYPVMVKAVQGGGGIGMQRAESEQELEAALAVCGSRAGAAFGDARVYVERALDGARHIEVQVARDALGQSVAFGERECSVQRRHQKVLEECPSPASALTEEHRRALYDGACRLLEVADYTGVATVEFLFSTQPSPVAHFLEVNARIQVEHPITEVVFGIDLVELQLVIASGVGIDPDLLERVPMGHAIEVRLYAEDPARGFLPQPGTLTRLSWPASSVGLRIEAAYREGDVITPHYDPLIAKLIAQGRDRAEALERLARALDETVLELDGPKGRRATNLPWLRSLLDDPRLGSGNYDTATFAARR